MMSTKGKPKGRPMLALVVDDHPLFRAGLAQMLRDIDPSAEVRPDGELTRHRDEQAPSGEHLTERQVDVLALLALGKSNKVIARELDLSEKTVKSHITAVFRVLGVINRTQAAMEARKRGLIT